MNEISRVDEAARGEPETPTHRRAERGSDRQVRLSLNLNPEVADVLKGYAYDHNVSITEAVRRAVAVFREVITAQRRGASIAVMQGDTLQEVTFETPTPRRGERGSDRQVRLSLNLNHEVADVLKGYADDNKVSTTEAVRRAAAAFEFVIAAQKSGSSVAVMQGDTLIREVVFAF